MYETVFKQIIQKVENDYNIFIPKDIIQLIYVELNRKHQSAIMIQNLIKELQIERENKTDYAIGIRYILVEGYVFLEDYYPRQQYDKYVQCLENNILLKIERCYEETDIHLMHKSLVELDLENAGYMRTLEYFVKNGYFA